MHSAAPFRFAGLPTRVVFGEGSLAEVGAEVARLGRSRALVLATPGHAAAAAEDLAATLGDAGGRAASPAPSCTPRSRSPSAPWPRTRPPGPTASSRSAAARRSASARRSRCAPAADQIAVPTTYAGSEMTADPRRDRRRRARPPAATRRSCPRPSIYDVELDPDACRSAHRRPAAQRASPTPSRRSTRPTATRSSTRWPRRASRRWPRALPRARDRPRATGRARPDALYGAWLCGACLGGVDDGRCTTSSATSSAAASACRTPRRTR